MSLLGSQPPRTRLAIGLVFFQALWSRTSPVALVCVRFLSISGDVHRAFLFWPLWESSLPSIRCCQACVTWSWPAWPVAPVCVRFWVSVETGKLSSGRCCQACVTWSWWKASSCRLTVFLAVCDWAKQEETRRWEVRQPHTRSEIRSLYSLQNRPLATSEQLLGASSQRLVAKIWSVNNCLTVSVHLGPPHIMTTMQLLLKPVIGRLLVATKVNRLVVKDEF